MNQYQQKFLEDMLLKDFSVATQKAYIYVVNAFLSRSNKFSLSEKISENICCINLFIKTASITTKAV